MQERLGTALRKVKYGKKFDGKGQLTSKIIDKIQNCFDVAVRTNSRALQGMKTANFGALFL